MQGFLTNVGKEKKPLKNNLKGFKKLINNILCFCDLTGTRTQDPFIKSEMLYRLSYQISYFAVVPETGLEPARPNGHKPLKLACLPIPPSGR